MALGPSLRLLRALEEAFLDWQSPPVCCGHRPGTERAARRVKRQSEWIIRVRLWYHRPRQRS